MKPKKTSITHMPYLNISFIISSLHQRVLCAVILTLFPILSIYAQSAPLLDHPRLLFTSNDEVRIKAMLDNNEQAESLAQFMLTQADSLLGLEQIPFALDQYGALLKTSRKYVFRLGTLSLAYRLTHDTKYADKVNETLLWVCHYPDWNPKHFLDTAEMSAGVSIAYDWLYDVLPAATKQLVRECLYQRAITIVLDEYANGRTNSWAKRESNWNVVCNAGMLLAALAVSEDYPAELETIIEESAKYLPNCLRHFAPDGVCYEGPAYWGYTVSYLSLYLKALADNYNDDAGLSALSGLEHTADYYINTLTPTGHRFNYGNANLNEILNTPSFFFFSHHYNKPHVAQWYRNELKCIMNNYEALHQLFFLALPWYDDSKTDNAIIIPRLKIFRNAINDLLVLNGDRKQSGALYLIAKGAQPMKAHQHLDAGTFILESDGVCWIDDLGADDYNLPGFWDYKPSGERWKYFRNNNFSHNTLSINGALQNAAGRAFVSQVDTCGLISSATIDMTSLYGDEADSVKRTFCLIDDYTIKIFDAIDLKDSTSLVTWSFITKAKVSLAANRVVLSKDDRHFYIDILSPVGAVFASYCPSSSFEGEIPIEGFTVVYAECEFTDAPVKIIVRLSSRP